MSRSTVLGSRKTSIIIPTRMESERLPGKPMLTAAGKPLVHWTYLQAKKTDADYVVVATNSREVAQYCQENKLSWKATSDRHPNGTSRCMEVFSRMKPWMREAVKTIINWQVDEPLIPPGNVDRLLCQRVGTIGTLVCPNRPEEDDCNQVKVVYSQNKCHWFSRAPMAGAGIHVGIYAFCPALLQMVSLMEVSKYAEEEKLEQLTWVEGGFVVHPIEIETLPLSINSAEDWEKFKTMKESERGE